MLCPYQLYIFNTFSWLSDNKLPNLPSIYLWLISVLSPVLLLSSFCSLRLKESFFFFFLSGFFFTDTDDSQDSRGREGNFLLFHSTTSTRSRTFRHLCATLHIRILWLIKCSSSFPETHFVGSEC